MRYQMADTHAILSKASITTAAEALKVRQGRKERQSRAYAPTSIALGHVTTFDSGR